MTIKDGNGVNILRQAQTRRCGFEVDDARYFGIKENLCMDRGDSPASGDKQKSRPQEEGGVDE